MHAILNRQRKLRDSFKSRGQSAHPSDSISRSDITNSSNTNMKNPIKVSDQSNRLTEYSYTVVEVGQ